MKKIRTRGFAKVQSANDVDCCEELSTEIQVNGKRELIHSPNRKQSDHDRPSTTTSQWSIERTTPLPGDVLLFREKLKMLLTDLIELNPSAYFIQR